MTDTTKADVEALIERLELPWPEDGSGDARHQRTSNTRWRENE